MAFEVVQRDPQIYHLQSGTDSSLIVIAEQLQNPI